MAAPGTQPEIRCPPLPVPTEFAGDRSPGFAGDRPLRAPGTGRDTVLLSPPLVALFERDQHLPGHERGCCSGFPPGTHGAGGGPADDRSGAHPGPGIGLWHFRSGKLDETDIRFDPASTVRKYLTVQTEGARRIAEESARPDMEFEQGAKQIEGKNRAGRSMH